MITDWLDRAERSGLNFYAFRAPGEEIDFGASSVIAPGIAPGGFVVAPWLGMPVSILPSDEELEPCFANLYPELPVSTSKWQHEEAVAEAIAALNGDLNAKVVISRVEKCKRPGSIAHLFSALSSRYPGSAVFCFRIVNLGTWIGASPELLMKRKGDEIETVALAGTRPAGSEGTWDTKNIREHQIVVDYIKQWMGVERITTLSSERESKAAGPVEHLATLIRGRLPECWSPEKALRNLAPTPALGGYPKDFAQNLIKKCESHDRGCYGGWLGPVHDNCDFDFYVNLRSMLVGEKEVALFVGGGITAESDPANEWEETCLKAETLKTVLDLC